MTRSTISAYLSEIGKRGGQAKGATKKRGNAAYYRELAQKSAKARAKKKRLGDCRSR